MNEFIVNDNMKYGYGDITIVPEVYTTVLSRSQCNCTINSGYLPIFTAPMSTVINNDNYSIWDYNKIIGIIPRSESLDIRLDAVNNSKWAAFSITEFSFNFCINIDNTPNRAGKTFYVLIDNANGHMKDIVTHCKQAKDVAKKHNYTIRIMVGNIANPETYEYYAQQNCVDYIRVGIGGGRGCTTSTLTGIHYPIASLIRECYLIKEKIGDGPAIIADGGIRGFADVVKAIGLGADYVMIGGEFAKLFESASPISYKNFWFFNNTLCFDEVERMNEDDKISFIKSHNISKEFYGMSTKKAQKLINPNNKTLKTAEGCHKMFKCTHTIKQWADNMGDYFRSAMSYCDKKTLNEFKGNVKFVLNSPSEIYAVNK